MPGPKKQPSRPQPRTSEASRRLAKSPPLHLSTETLQSTSSLASPHLLPTPTRHQPAQGIGIGTLIAIMMLAPGEAQWEESFFPKTSVAIVILFCLKWAGYLAVEGLNLLSQLSDRRSPYGV